MKKLEINQIEAISGGWCFFGWCNYSTPTIPYVNSSTNEPCIETVQSFRLFGLDTGFSRTTYSNGC